MQAHPAYNGARCCAFLCDLTSDKLVDSVPEASVDLASMIFVLSAITPEKMVVTLRNVHSVSLSHLG